MNYIRLNHYGNNIVTLIFDAEPLRIRMSNQDRHTLRRYEKNQYTCGNLFVIFSFNFLVKAYSKGGLDACIETISEKMHILNPSKDLEWKITIFESPQK